MSKSQPNPTTDRAGITGTLHLWAVSLGKNEKTLQTLFSRAGMPLPAKGEKVPATDIIRALFGDEYAAKVRNLELDARRKEREEKTADRELITMEEARSAVRDSLEPARQRIVALPAEMASRCNPSDPDFARLALEAWRDDALKFCRETLASK